MVFEDKNVCDENKTGSFVKCFFLQEKSAARADADENEDDDGKAQEDQELLDSINESKESNNGKSIKEDHIGLVAIVRTPPPV